MQTNQIAQTATGLITTFGSTSHQIIDAYRDGGKRLLTAGERRWNKALSESAPQLTAETRKNATRAQKAFHAYCAKGLALTADSAIVVVDTLVGVALNTTRKTA